MKSFRMAGSCYFILVTMATVGKEQKLASVEAMEKQGSLWTVAENGKWCSCGAHCRGPLESSDQDYRGTRNLLLSVEAGT